VPAMPRQRATVPASFAADVTMPDKRGGWPAGSRLAADGHGAPRVEVAWLNRSRRRRGQQGVNPYCTDAARCREVGQMMCTC
jgi:hypothetical protein